MVREASQTSVVPLMIALMPVPEPPPVTWIVVPLCLFMYSSAQRWPSTTIVSEPLTVMGSADAALRAVIDDASRPAVASTRRMVFFVFMSFPLVWWRR